MKGSPPGAPAARRSASSPPLEAECAQGDPWGVPNTGQRPRLRAGLASVSLADTRSPHHFSSQIPCESEIPRTNPRSRGRQRGLLRLLSSSRHVNNALFFSPRFFNDCGPSANCIPYRRRRLPYASRLQTTQPRYSHRIYGMTNKTPAWRGSAAFCSSHFQGRSVGSGGAGRRLPPAGAGRLPPTPKF